LMSDAAAMKAKPEPFLGAQVAAKPAAVQSDCRGGSRFVEWAVFRARAPRNLGAREASWQRLLFWAGQLEDSQRMQPGKREWARQGIGLSTP
jgi:hypothetical protein